MNPEEYQIAYNSVLFMAGYVHTLRLEELIQAGEDAKAFGPFVSPTLWREGIVNLDRTLRLAKALKVFQAEVIKQIEEERNG